MVQVDTSPGLRSRIRARGGIARSRGSSWHDRAEIKRLRSNPTEVIKLVESFGSATQSRPLEKVRRIGIAALPLGLSLGFGFGNGRSRQILDGKHVGIYNWRGNIQDNVRAT